MTCRTCMKGSVRQELDRQDVQRQDRQGLQNLAEKSFFYLTEDEIRRMQEAVDEARAAPENVVAIRRRRAKRGRFDSSAHPAPQPAVRRRAVPHRLRPQAQGQAAGHGPLRRVRLGPERLPLHAAVRLRAAGPLLEGPELHLRGRYRRGDAALHRVRRQPGAREGAARQPDQRLRALGLRAGVPRVSIATTWRP